MKRLTYIGNVTQDNVNLVKVFLNAGIRIRHIKNLPPMSFGVSDKEIGATIEKMEGEVTVHAVPNDNEIVVS